LLDLVEAADRGPQPDLGGGRPYLEFSLAEYGRRHARVASLMGLVGLDALILAEAPSVRYFTGLRSWFSVLPPLFPIIAVITADPALVTLVDSVAEVGMVRDATWIAAPDLYGSDDSPIEVLTKALKKRGLDKGRLGLELGPGRLPRLSPCDLTAIHESLPNAEFVDASDLLHATRAIKTTSEIAVMRRAADLIVTGIRAACEAICPGVTEAELTRTAAGAMLRAG